MDFSVKISPLLSYQDDVSRTLEVHDLGPGSLEIKTSDGRNLPLNLAQLLNSENEDSDLKLTTRANSVEAERSPSSKDKTSEDQSSTDSSGRSIMRITHGLLLQDQHGLLTPESLENLSPLGSTSISVETDLKHCLGVDARKSTLLSKYLHLTWSEIKKEAISLLVEGAFTKGETDLIVHEWHSSGPIDYNMLEEECFCRNSKAIQNLVATLSTYYSDIENPNLLVISTLETCLAREEYLRSDVLRYLPEEFIPTLQALLPSRLRVRPRWLPHEVEYITHCIKNDVPEELMRKELIIRTPSQIRYKTEALTKKIRKSEPQKTPEKVVKDPIFEALINDILLNDLTYTGILRLIRRNQTQKVMQGLRNEIEKRGGTSNVPFTKGELDYLRVSVQAKYSPEVVQEELIFRTKDEIDEKLKALQIVCVRQKKFASSVDRLMYEAQWYASMADTSRSKRRRVRDDSDDSKTDSSRSIKKRVERESETPPPTIGVDVMNRRREMLEKAAMKRRETLRLKREAREKRLQAQRLRAKARTELKAASRRLRSRESERPKTPVHSLLADAEWFQSVTGDGSEIKEGQKRKRKQAMHFVPEFETRQKLKLAKKKMEQKKIVKRVLRKKAIENKRKLKLRPGKRGRGRPKAEDYTDDSEFDSLIDSESEIESTPEIPDDGDDSSEEELEPSPFDPTNMLNDFHIPIGKRQLYNDSISAGLTTPQDINFSDDTLMLEDSDEVPFTDSSVVNVVSSHSRNYKSLPKSFPPFTVQKDGETIVNPKCIIRVRYLLYPEHNEAFLLALPKSNELNPVLEITKMMQIHGALYFSHSPELQEYIFEEYCQKLKSSVENDKFNQFMIIIDRWNLLMLELTPYPLKFDPSIDINREIRYYLPFNYRKNHSVTDLNLNKFFFDVINNSHIKVGPGRKPKQIALKKLISKGTETKVNSNDVNEANNLEATESSSNPEDEKSQTDYPSKYHNLRPADYPLSFVRIMNSQRTLSRFAVQQILTSAYARIVGPNSRKLRSYKAFTAEVYGELLPSFISEVLTKVGLDSKHLFYDLGSGVGNTTFQAALEFGVKKSGGCEIMTHASNLTSLQANFLKKKLQVWGLNPLRVSFALSQTFVNNTEVRKQCLECDVILVNNYLFEFPLNVEVGKLLYGLRPGSKIISLKNFIPPRYKAGTDQTVLDYLKVEKFEMSDFFSVSWTANKVPYYISTVQRKVCPDYL